MSFLSKSIASVSRQILIAGIGLLGLLSAGWWGVASRPAPTSPDASQLTRVSVRAAGECRLENPFDEYFGQLRARRTAEISTKIAERVDRLRVGLGDRVAQGDVLAELNPTELQNQLALARAEWEVARAKLAELVEGPRRQEIERAAADVSERQAAVALRTATHERMALAARTDSIAPQEVDVAAFMLQAARAQLVQAEQTLDELAAGVRPEQIAAQQATVHAAQARLDQLAIQLSETTIRAPFSGSIQARFVTEGELLKPGQPILSIVETDRIEAHVGLPPAVASELTSHLRTHSEEMRIQVIVGGRALVASLRQTAPALDDVTGLRKVILTMREEDSAGLVPGEAVIVRIHAGRPSSGIWVPRSSLVSSAQGQWAIYLVQATAAPGIYRVEQKPLEVLREQSNLVQVRGDLTAESLLVTTGTHRISPNQTVRIADSPLPSASQ